MKTTMVAMTEGHLDAVMVHEKTMFGTEAWSRNSYRDELRDTVTRRYFAVLDDEGDLLGWGGVRVVGDEAEILTVGVVPAARRHGVGSMLVAALLADAARRGATEIFLEVRVDNDAARSLYLANGFEKIGIRRGYYDAGRVDAVTMHKRLHVATGASS